MTHQHTHAKKKSKSIIPGFGLSFGIVMAILGIIVVIPLCSLVVFSARLSLSEFWQTITRPRVLSSYAVKSILLTLKVVVITVVVNTIFGLYAAWLITKFTFRGKKIISTLIDLPLTISPIIAGLIFVLTFGRQSFLYPYLEKLGIQIFSQITLPHIRWALLYGIVLYSARAMGEFGAVSVLSGHLRGLTNTMPLYIELLYQAFDFTGAFAMSSILVIMAVIILILRNILEHRGNKEGGI